MTVGEKIHHYKYGEGIVELNTENVVGVRFSLEGRVNFLPYELSSFKLNENNEKVIQHPPRSAATKQEVHIPWSQDVIAFIRALATSPITRFYLETVESKADDVEDRYFSLTGDIISPLDGVYILQPNNKKISTKAIIYFDPDIKFPVQLKQLGLVPIEDGLLNSTGLFWALIRLGFRLGRQHKTERILKSIPIIH
jgi:hypothetical protein